MFSTGDALFPNFEGKLKLVSVHVVIRHGDRSSLHTIPGVSNKPFNCLDVVDDAQSSAGYINLTDFVSVMDKHGQRKSNNVYGSYKLYPNEAYCDMGSLTPSGVKQHILNGQFLRSAYITKHNLVKFSDIGSASEQVRLALWIYILPFVQCFAFDN